MKTYTTVMYPKNVELREFWMGSVDDTGSVTEFFDVSLGTVQDGREDMMHYVMVEEDGDNIHVTNIQSYLVVDKAGSYGMVAELIAKGLLNPIGTANSILKAQRRGISRAN